MRAWQEKIFHAINWLAGLFMVATLLCILSSITGRIFPALAIEGIDAYAGYCTAAAAFLALAPTLRRGEHIRVTLLLNRLPPRAHRLLDIFCHLIGVVLSSSLAWYSIQFTLQSRELGVVSDSLDFTPLWIPQIGMALGTSLFALAYLLDLILLLTGQELRDAPPDGEATHFE